MNSGLQDAFNLAWKLALVSAGHSAAALLDSYEAERRPVAEMITSSGDAFENAQGLTDPAARRARDESLRAVFADPASRHHEAIAEAELDIDYGDSPIVMGDRHDALRRATGCPTRSRFALPGAKPACCTNWPTAPATPRWSSADRKPRGTNSRAWTAPFGPIWASRSSKPAVCSRPGPSGSLLAPAYARRSRPIGHRSAHAADRSAGRARRPAGRSRSPGSVRRLSRAIGVRPALTCRTCSRRHCLHRIASAALRASPCARV